MTYVYPYVFQPDDSPELREARENVLSMVTLTMRLRQGAGRPPVPVDGLSRAIREVHRLER